MEANEQMDALMGGGKPADTTDWKQKYEEAERALNSARVEEGRVRKLNAELEAVRKELSDIKSAKAGEDLESALTDEERESVSPEVIAAAKKMMSRGLSQIKEENEQRWNRETEHRSEMQKADFVNRINAKYPSFMKSVSAGGDKSEKWADYVSYNKASIADAYATFDFRTISYHIEQFYTNFLGIRVPSGDEGGSAAPDPRTSGGGNVGSGSSQRGTVYTQEEFLALYDKVEEARAKGDYAEMKRLNAEIQNAQKENRVK